MQQMCVSPHTFCSSDSRDDDPSSIDVSPRPAFAACEWCLELICGKKIPGCATVMRMAAMAIIVPSRIMNSV